jgi:hypothetical protein
MSQVALDVAEPVGVSVVGPELFELADLSDEQITLEPDRIIIDGFYRHPERIRALALAQRRWEPRRLFPGLQAVVPVDTRPLFAGLSQWIDVPGFSAASETAGRAVFSMITKKDAELAPLQSRQAHNDDHSHLAGLVYLNLPGQCRGGTSFYRHRKTGLDACPKTLPEVMAALGEPTPPANEAETRALWDRLYGTLYELQPGPTQYIRESTDVWELTRLVEMKHNRAVFYDSQLFHSNYTRDDFFGDTLETRRLTQTLFLLIDDAA